MSRVHCYWCIELEYLDINVCLGFARRIAILNLLDHSPEEPDLYDSYLTLAGSLVPAKPGSFVFMLAL